MGALQAANLAAKFVLELAAIAAFAYWGTTVGHGVVPVIVAVAASFAAIGLWGVFAAPRSAHRLPVAARVPFELGVFALAALALLGAGSPVAAIVFAAAAMLNAALLTAFRQWEH